MWAVLRPTQYEHHDCQTGEQHDERGAAAEWKGGPQPFWRGGGLVVLVGQVEHGRRHVALPELRQALPMPGFLSWIVERQAEVGQQVAAVQVEGDFDLLSVESRGP